MSVKTNDHVTLGDKIGAVGNTGHYKDAITGKLRQVESHLHLTIQWVGNAVTFNGDAVSYHYDVAMLHETARPTRSPRR